MELKDIVMRLIGPVNAVGSSHEDEKRLANLKELTGLLDDLMHEVSYAASSYNNHQDSMKKIGRYAHDYLQSFGRYTSNHAL